jgi:hypothetical protein
MNSTHIIRNKTPNLLNLIENFNNKIKSEPIYIIKHKIMASLKIESQQRNHEKAEPWTTGKMDNKLLRK